MDWPQSVYYAWVMYGAVSFQLSLYWIQRFYMQNWYGLAADFVSGNPQGFTAFSLGETINRLTLIIMWTASAFFWMLTLIQAEALFWWFTVWARFLHYIDAIRILVILGFKTAGMFRDTK